MPDWDTAWVLAPAAALLLGLLALMPLGVQVLARGVVFIDLAVAQVAACGALGAAWFIDHPSALQVGLAAAVAAWAGAWLVKGLVRLWPEQREALIGLLYVAAACLAVVAASGDPHGKERLTALLAADVLWAPWHGIAVLAGAALVVWAVGGRRGARWSLDAWFYPVFAGVLSVAVPVLGLYLVFAFLISPALGVRRGWPFAWVLLASGAAAAAGLALSWLIDWPSGACVGLALSVLGLSWAGVRRRPAA